MRRPDTPRDPVAGPDSGPEPPFPIRLEGPVIKGFGRGSKEVCCSFFFFVKDVDCLVWYMRVDSFFFFLFVCGVFFGMTVRGRYRYRYDSFSFSLFSFEGVVWFFVCCLY